MKIQEPTQSTSRETCLGIPFVEERPISEEERAALQLEARQSLGRSCAWGCSAPFVFFIFLCIMASVFPSNNDATTVQILPGIVVMVLGFAAGAACFLLANDRYKLRKIAKQDLRNGNIKRYQGFVPGIDKDNLPETPKTTGNIAGVDVSVYEPNELEIFKASRRLWRVNGTRVTKLLFLPEEHTAFQPEQAKIAAKWVEPAPVIAENTIDISQSGRRELSEQETNELRRRSRTAWRKPGLGALLFTAYFGGLAIAQWRSGSPIRLEWTFYVYVIFTIWIDVNFAKIARWSWRLCKDANSGMVIITRYPDEMNGEEVRRKGAVIEWLPNSKNNWTINGEPAPWRLRG